MTGLDILKEQMRARGCKPSQIESKTVAIVLDIVANNQGTEYTRIYDLNAEIERLKGKAACMLQEAQQLEKRLKEDRADAIERSRTMWIYAPDYVREFNASLQMCETAEGRDALRLAQIFLNTAQENTVYDHTEIIRGLWVILANSDVAMTEALARSGLKKIPDKIERTRRRFLHEG